MPLFEKVSATIEKKVVSFKKYPKADNQEVIWKNVAGAYLVWCEKNGISKEELEADLDILRRGGKCD